MKRKPKLLSFALILVMVAMAWPQNVFAASDSRLLKPGAYFTQSGNASGKVSALAVKDQADWANNPAKYVAFTTPNAIYKGYRSYQLPPDIAVSALTGLHIEVNYRGAVKSSQMWSWSLYDWQKKVWVKVGDNARARANVWTLFHFDVTNPARFIGTGGKIRLQLRSNNASGNAKLDYEAITPAYDIGAPPIPSGGKIPSPPAGSLYHSVYPGGTTGEEDDLKLKDVRAYETAAGKTAAWVYFSNNWYHGRAFPLATATWIRNAGSIPYIRMMLRNDSNGGHADPVYTLDAILKGRFDRDFHTWCASARDFDTPIIAEYGTEVNGEWFPWNGKWNGGGTKTGYGDPTQPDGPERFRDAYRRIIQICRDEGASNVTWVFHINDGDYPNQAWNHFENYYPGDEWIDWLAISVYGAQTPLDDYWTTFPASMDAAYPRLAALAPAKPIIVAEFGVTSGNPLGNQAVWARQALTNITAFRWPRVIAFSWWNEWWQNDNNPAHDTNMRVQDNPALTQVFQDLVGNNPTVLGRIAP